jgi:hypothetical protein
MENLDIESLHEEPSDERQTGRTTRILTEAIQNVDFLPVGSNIFIIVHSYQAGTLMMRQAEWIARELGFENVRSDAQNELKINGATIKFVNPDVLTRGYPKNTTVIFADHFALETNAELREHITASDIVSDVFD